MPPSAFVQLCGSSQDIAELLLRDLPLKSLAALHATCRGLRTAVPHSAWHRAAQREYLPHHPVQRAACIPTFLRRQHAASAAITAARFTCSQAHTAAGVVSTDLDKHATLVHTRSNIMLRVTELESGNVLQQMPLPAGLERVCGSQDLLWSQDGLTVAVRYGDAWDLLPDTLHLSESSRAGFVLANVQDGSCQLVALPHQALVILAGLDLSCSRWSCRHCLGVMHADAEQRLVLSVYSTSATVLASTAAPQLHGRFVVGVCRLLWSPSGQALAVLTHARELCLWQPFTSHAPRHIRLVRSVDSTDQGSICWAPCSTMLLINFDQEHTAICDLAGQLTYRNLKRRQQGTDWGLGGVVSLSGSQPGLGSKRLLWHPVVNRHLQRKYAACEFSPRGLRQPILSSLSGTFCACLTWQMVESKSELSAEELCVEICSPAAGSMIQQPIPPLPGIRTRSQAFIWAATYTLAWSSDSSRLLCSDKSGSHHMMLLFE